MLPFHPLTMADKQWIDSITLAENSRSADFAFGNMFLWDEKYKQFVCRHGNRVVTLVCAGDTPFFPFPIGSGALTATIEAMAEHARFYGFPFLLHGVEEHHKAELEKLFPGRFEFKHERDYDDYLYLAEKLSSLSGKKLHGKRNHINRFESAYNWAFRPLEKSLFSQCLEVLEQWQAEVEQGTELIADECRAITRAFENFEDLGLIGGALFVEESLAAFTIGERISSDTFNVHFEKARSHIDGAYPMINREFVRHVLQLIPELKYINREDDMGLENIRRAKKSYYPDMMVEKYSALWKEI